MPGSFQAARGACCQSKLWPVMKQAAALMPEEQLMRNSRLLQPILSLAQPHACALQVEFLRRSDAAARRGRSPSGEIPGFGASEAAPVVHDFSAKWKGSMEALNKCALRADSMGSCCGGLKGRHACAGAQDAASSEHLAPTCPPPDAAERRQPCLHKCDSHCGCCCC